ncbi:MAG: alpha/beta hydrolase [Proteobacteria bacterium]|nr:alpha/beta hydrolase [Pseudomonadota bacterium]
MVRMIALAFLLVALVLPAQAEEVKIKHNGLTLNANLNLAPGKSLADGVVLMLHGTLAHKDMEIMKALQDSLIQRGFSNLAFNLSLAQNDRHGMIDCAGPHRHMDSNAVKEIGLWVDWLKAKGAGAITILGHSRGGNQVARYVAGNPDAAVKRAVLVAPGTTAPEKQGRGYQNSYKKDLAPLLEKARALVKAGKGDTLMQGVDFVYCPNTSVAAASFVDYYSYNPDRDTPSMIKRTTMPLLAVIGDKDTVNPYFAGRMKGTKQANVKFVLVAEAGHFFLDLFGEDLADAVAAFVVGGSS